ncbi:hypothetical protein GCM10023116_03920 [Kistimonas scapharcae]|uniref:Uncharacterized protein n=1 Tax=Kistimonas scapharcae TaxID=1036133 RepID=A0ABP8UY56_9GAMM
MKLFKAKFKDKEWQSYCPEQLLDLIRDDLCPFKGERYVSYGDIENTIINAESVSSASCNGLLIETETVTISEEEKKELTEKLDTYGEESVEFKGFLIDIKYDTCPSDPFADWDQPDTFGISLSHRFRNHCQKSPVDVADFLYWVNDGRPLNYIHQYRCTKPATCGHEWEIENQDKEGYVEYCPECDREGRSTSAINPYKSEIYDDELSTFFDFENEYYWTPVYVYSHGMDAFSTGSPVINCPWDSGCCGITFISKKELLEHGIYSARETMTTKELEGLAEKFFEDQIQLLDDYHNGNVYGFTVTRIHDDEEIDGCGGFLGDEGRKDAISNALDALTYEIKNDP